MYFLKSCQNQVDFAIYQWGEIQSFLGIHFRGYGPDIYPRRFFANPQTIFGPGHQFVNQCDNPDVAFASAGSNTGGAMMF
jgi:hypothetical protein